MAEAPVFRCMKKLYLLIIIFIAAFIATQAQAQPGDTVRVLFLGNSFLAANNLPAHFEGLAKQAGRNVTVQAHAPGGVYIGDTRPGMRSHAYDPYVHQLIRSEKWDYIVAQDNQGHYSYGYGQFPGYAEVYKGHTILRDSLLKVNPCGKLIMFSGWCFRDGFPGEFPDGKSMNQRVYENYTYVNKTVGQIVAPVSISWNRIIDSLPAVELWSPDGAHPSNEGSYLAAATIYATIFRSNPDSVQFDGGVAGPEARFMRRTAFEAVMDSLAPTGLGGHTITLTASTTQLSAATGFRSYQWYSGGRLITTTTTANYTPAASGCYHVIGMSNSGCPQRSKVVCFTKSVIPNGVPGLEASGVSIFPNPGSGAVQIRFAAPVQDATIVVYDLKGSVVHRQRLGGGKAFRCDLTRLPASTYMLQVETEAGSVMQRVQLLR